MQRPIGAAVAPAHSVAWGAAVADSDLRAWIHARNTTGAWTGWVPLWVRAKTETAQFWSDAGSTVKALEMSPFYSGSNPFPLFTKGSHPWPLADGSTDAIYALNVLGPQPIWPYTKASGGWASTLTTPDTKDPASGHLRDALKQSGVANLYTRPCLLLGADNVDLMVRTDKAPEDAQGTYLHLAKESGQFIRSGKAQGRHLREGAGAPEERPGNELDQAPEMQGCQEVVH